MSLPAGDFTGGQTGAARARNDVLDDRVAIRSDILFAHLLRDLVDAGYVAICDFKGRALQHRQARFDALAGNTGKSHIQNAAAEEEATQHRQPAEESR